METGCRGTFAIQWAQSEIDGLTDAPVEALTLGASWCWHGTAVRVDGPQDLLVLEAADGVQDLRARAARAAGRLAGPGIHGQGRARPDGEGPLRDGFAVTDGRRQFAVSLLRDPASGRLLLAFPGAVPKAGVEHWISQIAGNPARLATPPRQAEICFTGGTRLRIPGGECPVEELLPGDRVLTRDDGAQEVLWIGHSHVTGARLHVTPSLRPVRIRAWAIDGEVPDGDLLVSPQHRLLVRGRSARALYGTDEVLVAASDLINDRSITVAHSLKSLTYYHLLLARHQVVWANGVPSETFHPAEAPLDRLDVHQRADLFRLLPDLAADPTRYGAPARRLLSRAEAAILRHDLPRRLS